MPAPLARIESCLRAGATCYNGGMFSSLLIKPAGPDCNLACSYCFYRPKAHLYPHTKKPRMSAEILRELVRQYLSMAWEQYAAPTNLAAQEKENRQRTEKPPSGQKAAAFCWQGGEPTLMGLDFFRHAVALQQKFGRAGQIVANSLQTNGMLLTDEWARFLSRYRFLVGLSLDGPPEIHDVYRRGQTGQPTQRLIVRAWRLLQSHNVETNILCMITSQSAPHARRLFSYFYELGVRFMQFIPCLEWHPHTGSPLPYTVSPQQYGEFLCELLEVWRPYAREISIRVFDDILARLLGHEELVSCEFQPACGDYLVVEHNGDIYACDFFVDREHYWGNIAHTPLEDIPHLTAYKNFSAEKSVFAPECEACSWLRFCQGGCPRHRRFGSRPQPSPTYLCAGYQLFFAHAIPTLNKIAEDYKQNSSKTQIV